MPNTNPWLPLSKPDPNALLRLFCFPYAGANARIFRSWEDDLPPGIEVIPIELPGRGSRISEPLIKDFSRLLEFLYADIISYLDVEFAFFGHSMGALISYGIAHLLRDRLNMEPSLLFISGQKAPQLSEYQSSIHKLPDYALVEELRRLNGTPGKVLEDEKLMRMLLPIIRADFAITETYSYCQKAPLACGISAFGGLEDADVKKSELNLWQGHTTSPIEVHMLPGDHFFIHTSHQLLLRLISRKLIHYCKMQKG